MDSVNPFALNIEGVTDLIESPTNKIASGGIGSPEGTAGTERDLLYLPMTDEELLDLRDEYEKLYSEYEGAIVPVFKRNLRAYLGRINDGNWPFTNEVITANYQWTAMETFLAAAFAENPEPVVWADNTPEGNQLADAVKTMLAYHAQELLMRRKLQFMVRQWGIYQLGVIKMGWDEKIGDVEFDNRKIEDFVFDPNGYVDAYGDFSSWLGERIGVTAKHLTEIFPEHKEYISMSVQHKMGTPVVYTQWWTDDFTFSTYKGVVLEKSKNPYFTYEDEEEDEAEIVEFGEKRKGRIKNHFAMPKKPYVFLSYYSLRTRPHDLTGNIEQNIPNQNKITRRVEQLDAQISQANNGLLFSMANFNQETAKQAANALTDPKKGQVLVPQGGPLGEAVFRLPAPNVPAGVFDELEMSENNLLTSWGTQGIISRPEKKDTTARGMILSTQKDTSRIGGGIGDSVEQVARSIFNWLVQLYTVFYDEKHFASIIGTTKALEYTEISNSDIDRSLVITVAPNSMKPKDDITQINQAVSFFEAGAIGPKTLLKIADFPNPDESAEDGLLYKTDPALYMQLNFPELMQRIQQIQQQAQAAQQAQATPPPTEQTAPVMHAAGQAMPPAPPTG